MRIFLSVLAVIIFTWLLWVALIAWVLMPDPPEFNPVSVAPSPPVWSHNSERQKRYEALSAELKEMEAKNDKRIVRACAAGDLPVEYCD